MAVFYIDEIMGRGKTSAMINYINSLDDYHRIMFITPYLKEVDRVRDACSSKLFLAPQEKGGKLNNIRKLISSGTNIVSTHALFGMFDSEIIDLIASNHYTLILDEVPAAIAPVGISPYDAAAVMKSGYAKEDENGCIHWVKDEYVGKLEEYRRQIESGFIYKYNDAHWITVLPPELYMAFDDVYVMTYLFPYQYQRYYFDMMGIPYTRKYVAGNSPETYRLSDTYEPGPIQDFRPLIHILENSRMNEIGNPRTALSKSWYKKNSGKYALTEPMAKLKSNLTNYYINIMRSKSRENLWTTYCTDEEVNIDWPRMLSAGGYSRGFLPCNAKGTNEFRHKTCLAYLVNVFPNTSIRNYLATIGIEMEQDIYALSEMIQWIWRSAIRDGKEINLYIPSKRMRTLLINWLNDVASGSQYQQEARSCS